jgi:hypothetical protein
MIDQLAHPMVNTGDEACTILGWLRVVDPRRPHHKVKVSKEFGDFCILISSQSTSSHFSQH